MHRESIYHKRWYAEEYDEDRFGGAFGHYLHDQEVKTSLSMISGNGGRVLDVGAGTGKLSIALMRQSQQVTSVDSSSEMLRIAWSKAGREGITLKVAACDAHYLCFRDNTFECVISSRVLMHLADWRKALSELCRVAKGIVIVDFPPLCGFSGLDSLSKRCKGLFVPETRSYKAFLIRNVIRELRTHHFRVVLLRKEFFMPIAFHRRLNRPGLSLTLEKLCRRLGLVWLLGAPITVKAIRNGYPDAREQSYNG